MESKSVRITTNSNVMMPDSLSVQRRRKRLLQKLSVKEYEDPFKG